MKSKLKVIIVLNLIVITGIISLTGVLYINDTVSERITEQDNDNPFSTVLKESSSWNLSYIYIDNNWTATEGEAWCTKVNGVYIIENVTIDATNSPTGCGIFINNSKNDNFVVRNCTLYNSPDGDEYAGIKLYNTCNGTLIDNYCSNNWQGIKVEERCENISVINNTVNDNYVGIWIGGYCEVVTLSGNTLVNNNDGIVLIWVYYVNLLGNEMWGGGLELIGAGTDTHYTTLSIYTNNTVNGKPLYYYYYEVGLNSENFSNAGQIFLYKCHNSNVSNLNVSNTNNGIQLVLCENNTFTNITANNNDGVGIIIYYQSNNNTVSRCELNDNSYGLWIHDNSHNNTIYNNTILGSFYGIYISRGDYNNITNNTITNSYQGIRIRYNSNNNEITRNVISKCTNTGVIISDANNVENNTIYNNRFIDNTLHAKDDSNPNANFWDNGIVGNCWDNYTGDDRGDGIGNIPYYIPGSAGAQDNLPSMECHAPANGGGGGAPFPILLILIISVVGIAGVIALVYVFKKRK